MVDAKLPKSVVKKINKKFSESLQNYRKYMSLMIGDMPIGCLCLPKTTEKALIKAGFLRVYDLFDCDLTEIKGIGNVRAGDLATRLDQFISMR